ncbi:uncharacterized protein [Eucyclogobius newberryi]|uniref:uncharacterized protein n=1 Tax=Eucyclogobius newberryi TaxID=166745 RepID=UPI003B5C8924
MRPLFIQVPNMALLNILFLMQLVFFVVQSDCRDNKVISTYVDEDVSFDCFHSKPLDTQSCSRLKFTKISSTGSKVILAWPEIPELPNAGRIKWITNEDVPNVLTLTKVQTSDGGDYSCEIWNGWKCLLAKNFTLKIKRCPSQVKAVALGSFVTLDCLVGDQARVEDQSWTWHMLKSGNPDLLTDRFQVNGSTVSLKSASGSDSGWYRCQYRLGDNQRCMDINLQVGLKFITKATQVPTHTQNTQILHGDSGEGFSTANTVAVLAGVVILAALVGAGLYWKHNNNKVPQETPEYEDCVDFSVTYDVVAEEMSTSQPSFQDQD